MPTGRGRRRWCDKEPTILQEFGRESCSELPDLETLWRDWEKQQEMAGQQCRRSYLTMFGENIHRMREDSKKEQLGS